MLVSVGRMSVLLLLLLFMLIFLFPITLYCTVLAGVNRRPRPLMVSGSWDVIGVLLACSGFFFAAGPFFLWMFYDSQTQALLMQSQGEVQSWVYVLWGQWWPFLLGYYVLIFLMIAWTVWSRQRTTVIYNLEPALFDAVWEQAMDACQLMWARSGNRIFMSQSLPTQADAQTTSEQIVSDPSLLPRGNWPQSLPLDPSHFSTQIRLSLFPLFCNVSLVWSGQTDVLRPEIEAALIKTLGNTHTEDNPAANWLLGTSVGLFGLMLFCVALMFLMLSQANN